MKLNDYPIKRKKIFLTRLNWCSLKAWAQINMDNESMNTSRSVIVIANFKAILFCQNIEHGLILEEANHLLFYSSFL